MNTNAFYLRTDIMPMQYETVEVPTVDENGTPVMAYRQQLGADGNPVAADVTLDDGSIVQMPVMEQVQVTHTEQRSVYPPLPKGYMDVSEAEHRALFEAQSQGLVIQPDAAGTGRPVALSPAPPTEDALLQERSRAVRTERDTHIAATDYLMAADYPLDDAQRAAWAAYRQALRDMPQATGFPWDGGRELTPWPVRPASARTA